MRNTPAPQPLNILLCAYACEPGLGSEENVGWDTAVSLAKRHRITVLTRPVHASVLEEARQQLSGDVDVSFVYYDLPSWLVSFFGKLGKLGVELGYWLWLKSSRRLVSELHHRLHFDTAQHVTYARYWMPTPLVDLPIPWIWGPVGGGESIPEGLRGTLSPRGRRFEWVRDAMRTLGEKTPLVRRTARRAALSLANTDETATRMKALGADPVAIENSAALSDEDLAALIRKPRERDAGTVFASIGRLLEWKGFHLGLRAFAEADLKDATYFVIGDGPARARLEGLSHDLGISGRVHFAGSMPRQEVLELMGSIDALIHPSLHESGGFVCLEAMASSIPVVCIDIGGPGHFVGQETGWAIAPGSEQNVISGIARALSQIHLKPPAAEIKGRAARIAASNEFAMSTKAARLSAHHIRLAENTGPRLQAPVNDRNSRRRMIRRHRDSNGAFD